MLFLTVGSITEGRETSAANSTTLMASHVQIPLL